EGSIARLPRVEDRQDEPIPPGPFADNFRHDLGKRGFETSRRAIDDTVFEAVCIRQAGEPASLFIRLALQQYGRRGSRSLVGVNAGLRPRRDAVARHQVIPGRKLKKAIAIGSERVCESAWQTAKIRTYVDRHRARTASSASPDI